MNIVPAIPAPEFKEIKKWSDDNIHTLGEIRGKTILLDFWTYTCIYCLRTIPTINKIKEKYADKGLMVIGIHSAEYDFAKNIENIQRALQSLKLDNYLTGFDTKNKTWESYGNSYWPKHILIDKDGFVRYEHPGYGKLSDFEEAVCDLLDLPFTAQNMANNELNKAITNYNSKEKPEEKEGDEEDGEKEPPNEITKIYGIHFVGMAPETCVGYSRLRRFGNNQKIKANEFNIFIEPSQIIDNIVYLRGKWLWEREGIIPSLDHKEKNPAIIFKYNLASNVNILVGSTNDKIAVADIKIDGQYLDSNQLGHHIKKDNDKSFVEVTWPFIMNVVKTGNRESHTIEILPRTDNFYFYTFIFG